MSLIAKQNSAADFEPLAAGLHHAVCYGIVDLGTQPSNNPQFKPNRKVAFLWEVPHERYDFEKDGVKKNLPRAITGFWTLSLGKKSKMRPMLESWRGRPFTEEELAGFDVKKVLGANCYLNVVHTQKGDRTYANVLAVNPLPKGQAAMKTENPVLFFSLDDCQDEITFPQNMPEWLKAKIMFSDEYIKSQQQTDFSPHSHEEAAPVGEEDFSDVPF